MALRMIWAIGSRAHPNGFAGVEVALRLGPTKKLRNGSSTIYFPSFRWTNPFPYGLRITSNLEILPFQNSKERQGIDHYSQSIEKLVLMCPITRREEALTNILPSKILSDTPGSKHSLAINGQ